MLAHHLRVRRVVLRDVDSLRAWLLSNSESITPADVLQAHGEIHGLVAAPSGGSLGLAARQLNARWTLAQLQVVTASGEDWTLRAIARCEREPGLGAQVLDLVDCACDVLEVLVGVSEAELFASFEHPSPKAIELEATVPRGGAPRAEGALNERGPCSRPVQTPAVSEDASGGRRAAFPTSVDASGAGSTGQSLWLEAAMVSQAHAAASVSTKGAVSEPSDRAPTPSPSATPARATPAAGVVGSVAVPANHGAKRPASGRPGVGDYVHHPKFGICRVDQVRDGDAAVLRTYEGPRKTVKLSLFSSEPPVPYQGRRLFNLIKVRAS